MKKTVIRLVQSLFLLCALSVTVYAGNTSHDGYLVKLNDNYPVLYSHTSNSASIVVVDTLAEAEAIPQEYVEYIEPNYIVELFDNGDDQNVIWAPNDPLYPDYQQPLQALDGLALYRAGLTGEGIKVGFVDSGINASHEDLNADTISGVNFHSDGLAYSVDSYGHGTFAAGILAAQIDNNTGLCGMAPDVQIMAYRAFSTKTTTMDCVVNAIDQAVADGCQIINLSLGLSTESITLEAAVNRAIDSGAVVVAAVGNNGTETPQYPASYDGVIGVGSVKLSDDTFAVSNFSQRNNSVFVTAPGEGLAGLGYTTATSYRLDLTSANNSGTSYAAPAVSALAALALDYDTDITADGVRYLLRTTAQDMGEQGYDTSYGYGVIDPAAFLTELQRDFEINYELNGGELHGRPPASYTVTDDSITLSVTPIRNGYIFKGWYTDEACTAEITEIPAGSLGDFMLYAAWTKAPSFAGVTESGQLQIETEAPFAQVQLFRSDYDASGKLVSCSIITVTLHAGNNLFTIKEIHEEGSYSTFFLLNTACSPLTAALTLPGVSGS